MKLKILVGKKRIVLLAFAVIIMAYPASAYLDPGVGSVIWQILLALILGVVFTIKLYWMKIKKMLKYRRGK
jgi:membrane protein CcdC involved in cytochrome C biogenesis